MIYDVLYIEIICILTRIVGNCVLELIDALGLIKVFTMSLGLIKAFTMSKTNKKYMLQWVNISVMTICQNVNNIFQAIDMF